jgi:hypothetical protein
VVTLTDAPEAGPLVGVTGDTMTISCVTSPSNPQPLVEWYLGSGNLVTESVVNTDTVDGSYHVVRSTLNFTINHTGYHGVEVFCRASNVPGHPAVESPRPMLDVWGK